MTYNPALDHDKDGRNGGDIRALQKRMATNAALKVRRAEVERKWRAREGAPGYAGNVQAIRAELDKLDLAIALTGAANV